MLFSRLEKIRDDAYEECAIQIDGAPAIFRRAMMVSKDGASIYQQRLGISKMSQGQKIARGAKQLDDIMDEDSSLITSYFSVYSDEDYQRQKSQRFQINQETNVNVLPVTDNDESPSKLL